MFGTAHVVNVNTASAGKNNATLAQALVQLYLETGGGPLSIFGPGYYGFEKLPEPYRRQLGESSIAELDENFPPDWPEIEWLPNAAYNGYNRDKVNADPVDGKNYATLMVALVAPMSRGTVSLNAYVFPHLFHAQQSRVLTDGAYLSVHSPDMSHLPAVDPAWLTSPTDRALALQAFKRQREIWQILVDLGVADPVEAFPGPDVQSDEEIMRWIGEAMITVYHASGTWMRRRFRFWCRGIRRVWFMRLLRRLRLASLRVIRK